MPCLLTSGGCEYSVKLVFIAVHAFFTDVLICVLKAKLSSWNFLIISGFSTKEVVLKCTYFTMSEVERFKTEQLTLSWSGA